MRGLIAWSGDITSIGNFYSSASSYNYYDEIETKTDEIIH